MRTNLDFQFFPTLLTRPSLSRTDAAVPAVAGDLSWSVR
jgi:hypothetical protein